MNLGGEVYFRFSNSIRACRMAGIMSSQKPSRISFLGKRPQKNRRGLKLTFRFFCDRRGPSFNFGRFFHNQMKMCIVRRNSYDASILHRLWWASTNSGSLHPRDFISLRHFDGCLRRERSFPRHRRCSSRNMCWRYQTQGGNDGNSQCFIGWVGWSCWVLSFHEKHFKSNHPTFCHIILNSIL